MAKTRTKKADKGCSRINNDSPNWRDWSARKLCDEYDTLPDEVRAEIDGQATIWAQQAKDIADEVERPFRSVCPDYDRNNLRSKTKLFAKLANYVNVRIDEMGDMLMPEVLGIADAVADLRVPTTKANDQSTQYQTRFKVDLEKAVVWVDGKSYSATPEGAALFYHLQNERGGLLSSGDINRRKLKPTVGNRHSRIKKNMPDELSRLIVIEPQRGSRLKLPDE
jgi:hypothetical protein